MIPPPTGWLTHTGGTGDASGEPSDDPHCVKNGDNRRRSTQRGEVSGGRGCRKVTRRKSNCLTTLEVLEMICDLFRVCAHKGRVVVVVGEGESHSVRERGTERGRKTTVSNVHFLPRWGHA